MSRRSYKFRLYPTKAQARDVAAMVETHRRLYNSCLAQRKDAWEQRQESVGYTDQSKWFKNERTTNPFYARLNFSSAQVTMRRLDKAFTAFYRRCKAGQKPGYPRFRGRDRYVSVEFSTYGDGIRLTGNRLRVMGIGHIKTKVHRPVEGIVKTATIKREANKWFVILSCDLGDIVVEPNGLPPAGIDLGLEAFLTTDTGERVENPRFLKAELPALRRAERSKSRKKKGGSNRRKAVRKVQRIHARVRNLRHDHHHKVALNLVRSHGLVAVESLNVHGMLRTGWMSRAISDVGWSDFVSILKYKAESAGSEVVEVDARGTSQECSGCGQRVQKALKIRVHCCPHCGLTLHRDENAAKNILARALQARTGPAGLQRADAPVSREAAP
jgi:putative transposase